jgi:hypothetical protein
MLRNKIIAERFAEALGNLGEKRLQTLYGYCDYARAFSPAFSDAR